MTIEKPEFGRAKVDLLPPDIALSVSGGLEVNSYARASRMNVTGRLLLVAAMARSGRLDDGALLICAIRRSIGQVKGGIGWQLRR